MTSPLAWAPIAAGLAVFAVGGGLGATDVVTVRVAPQVALAGQRVAISARVAQAARRCTASVTRPGARRETLPSRRPVRGRASWRWVLPTSARGGKGEVQVTCRPTGIGLRGFVIRALPAGENTAGKAVFLLNCSGCHTLADAGTQGTSVDLDVAKPSYATTVDRVVNGKGLMPPFRSRLTPQEIANVATYVSAAAGG